MKTTSEVEIGQTFRKRIQNNDSEDDPGSWENNGEDAIKVYQQPTKLKNKQTEMNNTLEGSKSKITEAEAQINSLGERMNHCHRKEYRKKNETMKTA